MLVFFSFFQFTLCHVLKGNKPDFHNALGSELSSPMYDEFLRLLGSLYRPEAIKGAIKTVYENKQMDGCIDG